MPPQLDQLADLICRGGAAHPAGAATRCRSTRPAAPVTAQRISKPGARRRSASGRSISCCCRSAATTSASARSRLCDDRKRRDLAPIAAAIGGEIRFGPEVSRAYLEVLDKRIKAVKRRAGEASASSRRACCRRLRADPVRRDRRLLRRAADARHGRASVAQAQQGAAAGGGRLPARLPGRLDCMASTSKGKSCPAGLATGAGTGFRFITEHIAEFTKRGICARDPDARASRTASRCRAAQDASGDDWEPYSPAATLPYAHRWRLIHKPNDAFLTAQHASRRDLAVRHPPAGLCGALLRRVPPDRGSARDRRRPRGAPRARGVEKGEPVQASAQQ